MENNNGHSLRDKIIVIFISSSMAIVGTAIGIYSKVETHDYRLAKVEASIDSMSKDIKLLLLRSR